MELIFLISLTIFFFACALIIGSLLMKSPGEEVKHRMEQYIAESSVAAKKYERDIDDDLLMDGFDQEEEEEDQWLMEARGRKKRKQGSRLQEIIGNIGLIITPKSMAISLAEKLAEASIPLKANEFVAIQFLAFMIGFFMGVTSKSLFMAILLGVVGAFLPNLWIKIAIKRKRQAFNDQILGTLMSLANGLKAGYSFLQGLEMVAKESPEPMASELKRVLKENSLGMNLEDTLIALNNRVASPDWDLVTTVVLIQRQVGGNLAEILDKISHTIRQRMKIKGDIQTKTAQAKASGAIVGALPFGIAMMIYVINPQFIMKLFTFKRGFFRGWFLVIFGLVWEVIGVAIIMKIVDIEV